MNDMDMNSDVNGLDGGVTPLSAHNMAGLHLKFVVPLAVGDMLLGREALDDVAEYTLHDMLGGLEPDTALLCLALCAQNVAAHVAHMPVAQMLGQQADQIVAEYGPVWLAYEAGLDGPGADDLRQMLHNIPEDLESLGDLLFATCGALEEDRAIAAILCDILGEQSYMHKEMAEARIGGLYAGADIGAMPGAPGRDDACGAPPPAIVRAETARAAGSQSNVIAFPRP